MVRTPHFHCRGPRFNPWSGELRSCKLIGSAKKKKKIVMTTPKLLICPENLNCSLKIIKCTQISYLKKKHAPRTYLGELSPGYIDVMPVRALQHLKSYANVCTVLNQLTSCLLTFSKVKAKSQSWTAGRCPLQSALFLYRTMWLRVWPNLREGILMRPTLAKSTAALVNIFNLHNPRWQKLCKSWLKGWAS